MSNDLISRKALLKELREITDEPHDTMFLMGIGASISVIEHADTALDKEKVIKELKANMSSVQRISGQAVTFMFSDGYYSGTKDAIEIVEKGGIG